MSTKVELKSYELGQIKNEKLEFIWQSFAQGKLTSLGNLNL